MSTTRALEESPAATPVVSLGSRSLLAGSARGLERHAVPLVAVVAVVLRLPFLASDPSRDEAGFLVIGQQWHSGGSSLYGNYWVDRPPLLISVFQLAAGLGGLVPLRLIGCLATVLVVVGAAHVARRIGGRGAAPWAALTAAALCVTPLLGGQAVNGELLSAPFVVGGMAAALTAIDHPDARRSAVAAALAGALTMGSMLVKQNMADVAVFGAFALVVAWRQGHVTNPRLARTLLAAASGAAACLSLVALWTMAHGTSLPGVFDAMYPFRIEAGRVMAASNRAPADARMWALMACWLVSGGALIMGVTAHSVLAHRLRGAAVWGLVATVFFDIASIALGGSYWNHYLIQLVVPIAVLAGVLVASRPPGARTLLTAVALSTVVALGVSLAGPQGTAGTSVGKAIRDVSLPQDTIITTWGHADVTRASGLGSPYPYLWSLPARTLDPRLTTLTTVLAGPRPPTWFVTWRDVSTWGFNGSGALAARVLAQHYVPVAQIDGHTIYRHRGVERAVPQLALPGTDLSATSARRSFHQPAEDLP